VLLKEVGLIDEYYFVHPKDIQDGLINVGKNDVLTNIPYVPGCGMWFDHHTSERERVGWDFDFKGLSKEAPSCARVIWEYYGGHKAFSNRLEAMMDAVDRSDSANLTVEEIQNPDGWILLSFIMDPRTGLGRYRDYGISNYKLMEDMIEYCRIMSAEQILAISDVQERAKRYMEQDMLFRDMLKRNSRLVANVVVFDLRAETEIYTGNRFLLYTMYPECNISIQIIWGKNKQNIVFTCGHSIINRTSKTDVGSLMLKYGGGGHKKVGTCQVPTENGERILDELIARMNSDG
jgi:nanoRNase/pAp phosphatase (c-di-AMP/oligoRNAs hydrolase)